MALAPTGYINQAHLAAEVQRITAKFGPEVVQVRHSIGPDTSGEPSIFLRIVLTDAASKEHLAAVTARIVDIFFDEFHPYENWGLNPYFNFRSQSEHAALNDPAWN